MTLKAVFTFTM